MDVLDYLLCGFKCYRRWRGGKWWINPYCVLGGTGPWVQWQLSREPDEDYSATSK